MIRTRKQLAINIEKHELDNISLLLEQAKSRISVSQNFSRFTAAYYKIYHEIDTSNAEKLFFGNATNIIKLRSLIETLSAQLNKTVQNAMGEIIDPEVYVLLMHLLDENVRFSINPTRCLDRCLEAMSSGEAPTHESYFLENAELLIAFTDRKNKLFELNNTLQTRALFASDRYSKAVGNAR